jgi:excisionase family DNA binding protein
MSGRTLPESTLRASKMAIRQTQTGRTVTAMFENYPDVVTVKELCRMLQIGKNTAYDLLNNRSLKSIRIGRKFLIPKTYIIAYLHVRKSLQSDVQDV